jgi:hypothetical protein
MRPCELMLEQSINFMNRLFFATLNKAKTAYAKEGVLMPAACHISMLAYHQFKPDNNMRDH